MMLGSVFLDVAVTRHDRTILRDNVCFPKKPQSACSPADIAPLTSKLFNQAFTVSCIVTQFAREGFGICRLRGSCMRLYDLI